MSTSISASIRQDPSMKNSLWLEYSYLSLFNVTQFLSENSFALPFRLFSSFSSVVESWPLRGTRSMAYCSIQLHWTRRSPLDSPHTLSFGRITSILSSPSLPYRTHNSENVLPITNVILLFLNFFSNSFAFVAKLLSFLMDILCNSSRLIQWSRRGWGSRHVPITWITFPLRPVIVWITKESSSGSREIQRYGSVLLSSFISMYWNEASSAANPSLRARIPTYSMNHVSSVLYYLEPQPVPSPCELCRFGTFKDCRDNIRAEVEKAYWPWCRSGFICDK